MALRNYILNGPSTVILIDNRNPYTSWQHHLDRTRGQRGGVDLVAAIGTPVHAPTPGKWVHLPNNGSAGNSGLFVHDLNPGWSDVFSHLSRYVGGTGQHFNQGDVIAYTGNTGGVTQHLHRHLLDYRSVRHNPWDYFVPAAPAGGKHIPIPAPASPTKGHPSMYLMRVLNGTIYLVTNSGIAAIGAPFHVALLQRMFNSYPGLDTFNDAERDIMLGYIRAANTADDGEHAAILAALAKVNMDPTPIVAAVKEAIASAGVKVDEASIVHAIETGLTANFAAIPAAVRAAIVK